MLTQTIANTLQSTFWNSNAGYYNQGELWADAVRELRVNVPLYIFRI